MSDVRIWRCHAQAPRDSDKVHSTLRAANRYYNALVEIERDRHARFVAVRREHAPDLAALEDEWERLDDAALALVREAKQARAGAYRKRGEKTLTIDTEIDAKLETVNTDKKRVAAAARPLRHAFAARLKPWQDELKRRAMERAVELAARPPGDTRKPGPRTKERANDEALAAMLSEPNTDPVWRTIAESDARAVEARKRARAQCGLSPGVYMQTEEAVDRAKKDSSPRPPSFRRFTGEGKISVQLRTTTFADLLSGTTMLNLRPNPKPGRKGRSEEQFTAQIRIDSNGRDPVWLYLPVVRLHRRPPDDAAVKWAWLLIRRVGERTVYELQLVLSHPSFSKPRRAPGVGAGGHVRLGWGKVPGGVCVATWDDGTLVVPDRIVSTWDHAGDLISHADEHWETVWHVLRRVLPGLRWDRLRGRRGHGLVRRVAEAYARHVLGDSLRSTWRTWVWSRPADLFVPLRSARRWLHGHPPREQLAWWLYTWVRKDQHLRQWSADVRRRAVNQRDALFREAAIRLATQHESVSIDSYSVAELKKRPTPLTLPGQAPNETAQHNVQVAAPGRFREILLDVMGPRCTPCERPGGLEKAEGARKTRNRKGKSSSTARKADGTAKAEAAE